MRPCNYGEAALRRDACMGPWASMMEGGEAMPDLARVSRLLADALPAPQ